MARKNRSDERRAELIRVVAATFAELGYRRATTAVLAERCGLQEAALYRLWPDKRAMFVAAIGFVGDNSERIWREQAERHADGGSGAERVVAYEARHLGEFGLYRILFAGLSETDDPEIAEALRRTYTRMLEFIGAEVRDHRAARAGAGSRGSAALPPAPDLTAWALLGLGTATNVGRELGLLGDRARRQLFESIGRQLLG
ncbi:MAG: TetR/AcrR family transcriptional regulator [Planctomycetota bacterium]